MSVTRLIGTLNSSATSCVCAVNSPCPSSHLPVYAVTRPSAPTAIQESSWLLPGPSMPCAATVSGVMSKSPASRAALNATTSAPDCLTNARREMPAAASAAAASRVMEEVIRSSSVFGRTV
jgi:hypothetical protein